MRSRLTAANVVPLIGGRVILSAITQESENWGPDQVRPGQIRRDPASGNAITVEKVDDGGVHGHYRPPGGPPGATGFSVWSLDEFSGFPLLDDPGASIWRVAGDLPWTDRAAEIYAQVGTVHSYRSHEGTVSSPQALAIDVVAPNEETARQRVAEISGLVGKRLRPEELRAEPTRG